LLSPFAPRFCFSMILSSVVIDIELSVAKGYTVLRVESKPTGFSSASIRRRT
jgi:hypothetical protein